MITKVSGLVQSGTGKEPSTDAPSTAQIFDLRLRLYAVERSRWAMAPMNDALVSTIRSAIEGRCYQSRPEEIADRLLLAEYYLL